MENYTEIQIFIDRMTSSKTEIKLVNQSVGNFSELGGLFALNPENPRVRCSIHRLATSSKTLATKDLPSPKGSKQKPAKSGLLLGFADFVQPWSKSCDPAMFRRASCCPLQSPSRQGTVLAYTV
jgi:hypothetical protein